MEGGSAPENREVARSQLLALREQHRDLDSRISDLERRPWLTPEEQVDLATMKKRKLSLKDQIFRITSLLGEEF